MLGGRTVLVVVVVEIIEVRRVVLVFFPFTWSKRS